MTNRDDSSAMHVGESMPQFEYEVKLKKTLVGFAVDSVDGSKKATKLLVKVSGFYTAAENDELIEILEQTSRLFIDPYFSQHRLSHSAIGNCLVVVNQDVAKVYVNPAVMLKVRVRRSLDKGESVYTEDVSDISRLEFPGIEIPDDHGVLFVTRVRWRTGVYFDFGTLSSETPRIADSLPTKFAEIHTLTAYHDLFNLDERVSSRLFSDGWFPFNPLVPKLFSKLYSCYREEFDATSIETEISDFLKSGRLLDWLTAWKSSPILGPEHVFLSTAIERYLENDFISALSILVPRIEGILRSYFAASGVNLPRRDQARILVDNLENGTSLDRPFTCLLLPKLLSKYLKETYFASFDVASGRIPFSRHTIGHGVCGDEHFNKRSTTQMLLLLQHISMCMIERA